MFLVDGLIFIAGVMLVAAIVSSKFSSGLGVPVLVLFLALGMLAGSEGLGRIEFDNYRLAHGIGTLSLVLILFDGGMRTPFDEVRANWKPSLSLATIGVVITAGVTGAAAAWILRFSWLEGMLLGSIVGSTDASAVFSVLQSSGVSLPRRLAATLEIESGSNDPMAVFLTVGLIEVIQGQIELGPGLLALFATEMSVGALVGLAVGYLAVWLVNRINLDAAGLYPVLVSACGLLAYGLAVTLHGSGFLSVYVAGIVIGNSRIVFQRGIFLFHDAGAWLAQILMFVMLGLLSFPSRLWGVAGQGLLIAAVLIFVARPLAVLVSLWPFGYRKGELAFLSWVGLKGAVPITLATFPLLFGVPGAPLLYDVVFFVVLISALIQGWTLPLVARRLGVEVPSEATSPVSLEISSLRHVEGDIVDFTVGADSLAAGRFVKDLALPMGVVIALIARDDKIIPPQGDTRIEAGDHVILVLRPDTRPLVNKVFARRGADSLELPSSVEFPLRGSTTVGDVEQFYDVTLEAASDLTLDELLRRRLGPRLTVLGESVQFPEIAFFVRGLSAEGQVERVGMVVMPQEETQSPSI